MGPIGWLLQWPVRALVLLLVAAMPLGVELSSFSTALGSAALIGLLGTMQIADHHDVPEHGPAEAIGGGPAEAQ